MLDFGFYNMDCMEGMKEFPDKYFDLAIVDPPYGGGNAEYDSTKRFRGGKRALKSWESEISGGMNRVVHVYDMEGEEIATYKGKFDIQENAQDGIVKVKFDVDGERHIIYGSTGTIVIDEIPVEEAEDADTCD